MVEFGNNLDSNEEFDVLHDILDFPMEWLEEDEDAEDLDINSPQCLGPIPSDVLMGLSMMSDENINLRSPSLFPRPVAPIPPKRKLAKTQDSGSFCTQTPVSILESSGSCPREKILSIKSDNAIPVQSRSKRVRYCDKKPLAAHEKSTVKIKTSSARLVKECAHCQTTETTLWRWGPLGPNTLCNACGLKFRSGRLFPEYRPTASPTFVPFQHSNRHAKVEMMRDKAKPLTVKNKIPTVKGAEKVRLAKHIDTSSSLILPQIVGAPEQERLTKHIATNKEVPVRKQLEKHVDTPCSLIPRQIAGVPEHKHVADHVDTSSSLFPVQIAVALNRKQLAKHVYGSSLLIPSHIVETPEQKQLAKHVDASNSLIPPPIRGPSKQKSLAKHRGTSCSHIPLQNKFTNDEKLCHRPAESSLDVSYPGRMLNASKPCPAVCKKCAHCETTETAQWRLGPLGIRSLCNACGLRYRAGSLLPEYRPVASPTFIPSQHSNIAPQTAGLSGALCTEKHVSLVESSGSSLREKRSSAVSNRFVGAPEQEQLTNHIDTSVEVPVQKQLEKHVDTSCSLIPPPIRGPSKRKSLAKHRGTCCSHIPLQNKFTNDEKLCHRPAESSLDVSYPGCMLNASKPCPAVCKKCAHCETTETAQWRWGPLGTRSLCNACGLRYRAGCLLPEYRPVASPTFIPSQHSNKRSEVLNMRIQALTSTAKTKAEHTSRGQKLKKVVPQISPQPEFVA